jgi:NH3-dependent NAD+ synthetase
MDLIVLFVVVFGGMIVLLVLMARLHPGSGADLLDWDPSKRMEARYAAEYEDMDALLESHNARRRARGLSEHTEDEYRALLSRQTRTG